MSKPYNQTDERILVDLLQQGNEVAFERIYNIYWDRLFAYTYNRLHDRDTSESIVQEVFLSLWANRRKTSITSSLSAFLYTATKNRLLNEIRSEKVRKTYAEDFAAFARNHVDNSNIEQQNLRDLKNSVEETIGTLPAKCQEVFRLSRQQHIPNQHIAEKLNISIKTVENYLTQALKHIRTSLNNF